MSEVKFEWDGEKIKKQITTEDVKLTPKDLLDGLQATRHQITSMENQKVTAEQQIKNSKINLKHQRAHEAKLKPLEAKCIELQIEKLKFYVKQLHKECMNKAALSAKTVVAKDPNAYPKGAEKQIAYLDYQKNLATHPKVAENICKGIITQYLYDTPVFDNPFLTTAEE